MVTIPTLKDFNIILAENSRHKMIGKDDAKIVFVGAGSAVWSSRIIIDLIINKDLQNVEVWLNDIDDHRLNLIYGFSTRYAREYGSSIKFRKTKDQVEAIEDADFVINAAMARGHGYYEKMRQVSERYGYYRGINSVEWNMVSDYHTIWGYYQFKLALEIAHRVEEYAPNAWLIQISNPVLELTTLISRYTKVKTIGLCHGHLGYLKVLRILGLRPSDVEVEMIGLNHLIWLTKFKVKGGEGYQLLDDWIRRESETYWRRWWETTSDPFDISLSPAAIDMYKTYGLLPIGDTVRAGTWKYHWDLETKRRWYGPFGGPDSEIGWSIYIADLRRKMMELEQAVHDHSVPLTLRYPPKPSGEQVVPIIDSIINDKRASYQVNVLNFGSIPGIKDDIAVEMPAEIDGRGVHRMSFPQLPSKILKYAIMPRIMRAEWSISAFMEGGRDHLFEWLIVDRRTNSISQANQVIDAILRMPENDEMAKHFK